MPNPYRIRSVSAPQRRRNPYIADTERQRQMQDWGSAEIAAPGWAPPQTTTQPDVSTNPYAPRWKRLGQPNPYAIRPSLPPRGPGTVDAIPQQGFPSSMETVAPTTTTIGRTPMDQAARLPTQPSQPLTSEQQIQLETQHGPYLGALSAAVTANDTEGIKRLLSRTPAGAERHPLVQRLKIQQGAGTLPLTFKEKAAQKRTEDLETKRQIDALEREGNLTEARETNLPLIENSLVWDLTNVDPATSDPVEVRTAALLEKHPTAGPSLIELKKLQKEAIKPGAPVLAIGKKFDALEKRYMAIAEKQYNRAVIEMAAVTEKQRIGNLADTLSKLLPDEQERRKALLSTEDLAKLNQTYPGGLPAAKPVDKIDSLLKQAKNWEDAYRTTDESEEGMALGQHYLGVAKFLREQAVAEMDKEKAQAGQKATPNPAEELRASAKGKTEKEQKRIYEQGEKLGYWK